MRVISGAFKGRRLRTPRWPGLRPTSDRLRETLFDLLDGRVRDALVLDGYAGTGALGLEAISRGAAEVVFVERDRRAATLIADNLRHCGVDNQCTIIRGAFLDVLGRRTFKLGFGLILLDPPYEYDERRIGAILSAAGGCLAADGHLVLERSKRAVTPEGRGLVRFRRVASGDSVLEFYTRTRY